jgi:hypothetical protein
MIHANLKLLPQNNTQLFELTQILVGCKQGKVDGLITPY